MQLRATITGKENGKKAKDMCMCAGTENNPLSCAHACADGLFMLR